MTDPEFPNARPGMKHERSPGMRYRQGEIPAVGRFGRTQGDPHSWMRTIMTVNLRRMPLDELQAFERKLAHHPSVQTRRFSTETMPLTSGLKMLATIRQELADRGHHITDFPERAHKRGPLSQSPFAKSMRRAAARKKAEREAARALGPPAGPPPDAPWLQQPNETKHEEEPK